MSASRFCRSSPSRQATGTFALIRVYAEQAGKSTQRLKQHLYAEDILNSQATSYKPASTLLQSRTPTCNAPTENDASMDIFEAAITFWIYAKTA